ncbi:MAG: arylesterase [Gammaproteobacteria bacterium]
MVRVGLVVGLQWLAASVLLMWVGSPASADGMSCTPVNSTPPTIVIVGDSLSAGYGIDLHEGWAAKLQERLTEKEYEYRVLNASISGDTTSGGAARLGPVLEKHSVALVIIELGGNDGLRGQPIRNMRKNLTAMIKASRAVGAEVALMGMRIPTNYGARYAESFHRVYASLADEFNTALTPFFLDGIALSPDLMQNDGIHPNAAAQMRLLDNAWPAIEQGLTDYCAREAGAVKR